MSTNNHNPRVELACLVIFAIGTFALFMQFEITELFMDFSRQHEDWELDELALSASTTLSFYAIIFAVRRWVESRTLSVHANSDSLTGLHNRRMIRHAMALEAERARRYDLPLSLLLLDIDHFKEVNDTHGHVAGDRVLQQLGNLLQTHLRSGDLAARWGGEEFLILVPATDLATARQLAEQVRQQIANQRFAHGGPITVSIGIAQWDKRQTVEALVTQADVGLYAAKQAGRNQIGG